MQPRCGSQDDGLCMGEKRGFVYFMSNKKDGVIYIGVSSELVQRVYQHRNGLVKGFTQKYNLKSLVYYEVHDCITAAIEAEKKLKNLHRTKKIAIIEQMNPQWQDLYDSIL